MPITPAMIADVLTQPNVAPINFSVPDYLGIRSSTERERRRYERTPRYEREYRVYPGGLITIGNAIRNNRIIIRPSQSVIMGREMVTLTDDDMIYMPSTNSLFVPSHWYSTATSISTDKKGLIIHECVHALNDYNRLNIPTYINELMAYTAQSIFYVSQREELGTGDTNIFGATFAIATRIIGGSYRLSFNDVFMFEGILAGDDNYAASRFEMSVSDGV